MSHRNNDRTSKRKADGCCCTTQESCDPNARRIPTVLIVDDEKDYTELLAEALLEKRELDIYQAWGAEHALAILRQREIDLMVCDHYLTPSMTGSGLLETAREVSPRTKRVLMTASPEFKVILAGVNRGKICAFINKLGEPKYIVQQILQELPG